MRPSRVLDGEGGDNAVGADQEEGAGAGGGGRRGLERHLEDGLLHVFSKKFDFLIMELDEKSQMDAIMFHKN